jgi:hypothetical protein
MHLSMQRPGPSPFRKKIYSNKLINYNDYIPQRRLLDDAGGRDGAALRALVSADPKAKWKMLQ